ncbi:NAD(P)-dependent alcohol dehydrogenase [Nocardioides sediminis]|uniref:NAD(P)-dependent alcohol dehydrogenase n=1 Tax=Nocardioides sediminis TaxID=433648 RepID=UPI001F435DF6|nr:NAD(P)-dependent alcohol dehydrogenase [Nocardioides sediminis]
MTSSHDLTGTATMRAITQDRYGGSDVLRLARVPRPVVRDGQVLLRVHAAGLDRGTEHLMTGRPYAVRLASGVRRPRNPVPGRDAAGTVVEVGSGVTRFSPGDEVFGVAPGSFAEYALADADKLAHKPVGTSFAEAAVVPVSAGTALQALTGAGKVQPGQSVLVTGASGGVGSYAVQLAVDLGAEVTGVCSGAKRDHVRALGAHHVLDRRYDDWADGSRRYDLVLDVAGNPSLGRLRRALTPRGTAVFVGGEGAGVVTGMSRQLRGALLSPFVGQRLVLLVARERGADYERLGELVAAGRLVPSLDRTFPMERAVDAVRLLEDGTVRGKVAVTM